MNDSEDLSDWSETDWQEEADRVEADRFYDQRTDREADSKQMKDMTIEPKQMAAEKLEVFRKAAIAVGYDSYYSDLLRHIAWQEQRIKHLELAAMQSRPRPDIIWPY